MYCKGGRTKSLIDLLANLSFNKGSTVRPAAESERRSARKKEWWSGKENDKNNVGGQIKKMAGKQQRDYWRDMMRQGDVCYVVSERDKDDHLLTPLHFNWQNKKLVMALFALFWQRWGRQRVTDENTHIMRKMCGGGKWKTSFSRFICHMQSSHCMAIVKKKNVTPCLLGKTWQTVETINVIPCIHYVLWWKTY